MNLENAASTPSAAGSSQPLLVRVLICAGVLFLVLIGLALVARVHLTFGDAIIALRDMVLTSVITFLWGRGAATRWSWGRTVGMFVAVYIALAAFWLLIEKLMQVTSAAR